MAKKKTPSPTKKKSAATKKGTAGANKTTGGQVSRNPNESSKPKTAELAPQSALRQSSEGSTSVPIVGIGSSAGGLEALGSFFKAMPSDSGIGFVLVVHLDPTHESLLPDLLQNRTKMPVCQIEDGMRVEPNHVYVIPPNKDLTILHGTLHLMELSQPRGANLPIDSFFRSLAQDQERNATCIILSGTGTDGTLGVNAIKGGVGMVMVQNEESAKYNGMPRSAIATGLADYVLPPEEMAEQLVRYTKHVRQKVVSGTVLTEERIPNALQKIFVILRARTGHDFSLYKKNTICRRIERRMNVHQIDDIADYVRYIQGSDRETEILFKELLIGVTNFFRDPDAFEVLRTDILPELLLSKPDDSAVRVWVPGCASGEEAYSVAILLSECMEEIGRHFHIQIFGTDLEENAINVARAGVYPESIMANVGPERIQRYFIKEDDGQFRVKKLIREMLVFARQNVIKDPPFTKLDLLSCRNLLIYLGSELQKKLLPFFHYSLKPNGILFLGSSETIGQNTDLFLTLNKKWKLFRRKPTSSASRPLIDFSATTPAKQIRDIGMPDIVQRAEEHSMLQLVETILHSSDTPPCAIINDASNVVYIHGRTGRFLELAEGKASVNIVEMARAGIKADLANAIRLVAIHNQEVTHRGLCVENNEGKLFLNLTVKPILEQSAMRGLMMVVFEETENRAKVKSNQPTRHTSKRQTKSVEQLQQELEYNKENLQTTIEELETSNEELKSSNEELQSTNEELQSTNEELETSKEELQSLNEESVTVNSELQARIDELSRQNDDMKNLLDSTNIATIFLDIDLRVRRFTPKATEIVPLVATDCGRPIKHLASLLLEVDLEEAGLQILRDLSVLETEVQCKDGRTYNMRIRPYRTMNNVIDGVVITFDETTQRKLLESKIRNELQAEVRLMSRVFTDGAYPIVISNLDGIITDLNDETERAYGWKREDLVGQPLKKLVPAHGYKRDDELFEQCKAGGSVRDVESLRWNKAGKMVPVLLTLSLLTDGEGNSIGIASTSKSMSD